MSIFTILARDERSSARVGILATPHGEIETPSYVVVGTQGKVRTLNTADLIDAKTQLIIANTYHLWRTLGDDGLKQFPGLHSFMDWSWPLMTDSGGFQVFSMGIAREQGIGKVAPEYTANTLTINKKRVPTSRAPEKNLVTITEDGVYFQEGDTPCFLNAEMSIRIQQQLDADIMLAFDEPTSAYHDYSYTKDALARTHRWAKRSLHARTSRQLLYGIVQGGAFQDLRRASASAISALSFDGYAIGGAFSNAFGSTRDQTRNELTWTCPFLPEQKPRHLLGIGLVEDLFDGVAAGIDTFDCVVPTREARHGSLWTRRARLDIKRGRYANDTSVLDPECGCTVCAKRGTTRTQLRALFHEKNQEAGRLASIHNIYFFNNLMKQIRNAIKQQTFVALRAFYIKEDPQAP